MLNANATCRSYENKKYRIESVVKLLTGTNGSSTVETCDGRVVEERRSYCLVQLNEYEESICI